MKFKSVRYGFKKFTEFYQDEVHPMKLKYFEFEAAIRDILFSSNPKYDPLREALIINNIPGVGSGEINKDDIELDPTFFKIDECRYNREDLGWTTYTFRVRYYLKSKDDIIEVSIKSRLPLKFFDKYINDDLEEGEYSL